MPEQFTFPGFELLGIWLPLCVVLIVVMMGVVQGTCAYLILLERKIAAWTQDRIGPNRVGPWGLLQPIADGLKFLFKEQIVPKHVDKLFYFLGPMVAVGTATLAFGAVPFGPTSPAPLLMDYRVNPPVEAWPQTVAEEKEILAVDKAHASKMLAAQEKKQPDKEKWTAAERAATLTYAEKVAQYNEVSLNNIQYIIAPRLDIGMVFIFAVGSLAVYGIVLGGWGSNNKYSFMGALRSSAQLISYEIPMGMSVLAVLLLAGSLNIERIIDFQVQNGWNVIAQPVMAVIFITAVFAECNRVPFDLSECEQELVGGYHTEYSGMKFALYFLGEYTHMVSTSFLAISLFFGGWAFPGLVTQESSWIIKLLCFALKMTLFIVFYMLIRWTIPRFRFDQLMGLAWKVLLPLTLLGLVSVIIVKYLDPLGKDWYINQWILGLVSLVTLIVAAVISLRMPPPPQKADLKVYGPGTPRPLGTHTSNAAH
jgi:NADH-quinone oxidoreductase subunit H